MVNREGKGTVENMRGEKRQRNGDNGGGRLWWKRIANGNEFLRYLF